MAGGPIRRLILLANALMLGAITLASPAHAEWREATSAHFIIASEGSERELIQQSRQLEAAHWLLCGLSLVEDCNANVVKLRIYMLRDDAQVRATIDKRGSEIAGIYRPEIYGAYAIAPRNGGDFSMIALIHEYTHHFTYQYVHAVFPKWFTEGFAEVVSTMQLSNNNIVSYGRPATHRVYELTQLSFTPLADLFARPTSEHPRLGSANYGEYWLVTHYLLFDRDRRGQFGRFAQALNSGASDADAYANFTPSIRQLQSDVLTYLRRNQFHYLELPMPADAIGPITVRVMSEAEGVAVPLTIMADNFGDDTTRDRPEQRAKRLAYVGQVAAAAARYPGDLGLARLLARVNLEAGRVSEAGAAADAALAIAPDDARSLVIKALAMAAQAAATDGSVNAHVFAAARALIVRANRLAPDDQMPLIANYLLRKQAGQPINDAAINGLIAAVTIVPNQPDLRMNLALELLRLHRTAEARVALAPVAYAPHASGAQPYALALIGWIDGGATGTIPSPPAAEPTPQP